MTRSGDPVRWGVLCGGHMAGHVGWVIGQTPGCVLVPGRYEELLDGRAEVVYVPLPHDLHRPWVLRLRAAGVAVLCEKPLGLSADEVLAMRAAGGLLMEAAMWRWSALLDAFSTALVPLGPVEHVESGFTIAGVGGWRADPAQGGALADLGGYPVGSALRWAGPVEHVAASGTWDDTALVLDHVSGATSALRCGFRGPQRQWLTATCAGGEVAVQGEVWTGSGVLEVSDGRGTERVAVEASPHAAMVAAVADAVRGGPAPGLDDALAVARVCDAARTLLPWPSRPS